MTIEEKPDAQPFAAPTFAARRRKRGGMNYALVLAPVGVLGIAAVFGFLMFGGHTLLSDALGGAVANPAEARSCLDHGNIDCAEADYRTYLAKYPRDGLTNAKLAILLTQEGDHKDAIPYYERAGSLGVSTYDYYANYANSLDALGRVDQAIKMNYAALQIVPSLVDVRGQLATELVQVGHKQEAIDLLESFDRTLQDEGQPPYFMFQIAQIKGQLGGSQAAAQLASNDDAAGKAGQGAIQLQAMGGNLFVPVRVDDMVELNFAVDSGAADVVLPASLVHALVRSGKLSSNDYLGSGWAILADGSRVPAQQIMIHSLSVGGHELHNVVASVPDKGGEPLLGQSFLRRFKSWSIDNRRRLLMLEG